MFTFILPSVDSQVNTQRSSQQRLNTSAKNNQIYGFCNAKLRVCACVCAHVCDKTGDNEIVEIQWNSSVEQSCTIWELLIKKNLIEYTQQVMFCIVKMQILSKKP